MQPTATMATAATTTTTTTATVALTTSWDNATGRPTAEPDPILDNYVLLVVVMSLFVGGTLVVLSGVLLLCKRCWDVHQRLNRAMEEAEKTTTTYLDNGTHPAQDPDFRGEDPECQDAETERFLSTSSTGRRVSFNEAALFEQSRKTQDKGRRYTLTEGDFHHLKNARLTHLHLPPLKIVTIHECDSGEASSATTPHPATSPKATLAIFQPPGKALTGRSVGPSSALPGDPYNSAAGATDFAEISPSASSDSGEGTSLDAGTRSTKAGGPGAAAGPGEAGPGSGAGTVLQFLTRLRRHASLDGASPYFKVKKWKLEPSQRAASLDTRGSPKRHHFQRQRAASESTEQEEGDAPQEDFIQYIARAGDAVAFPHPRPFLASPPPALGRYFSVDGGARGGPVGPCPPSPPPRRPRERSPGPVDTRSPASSGKAPPRGGLTGATSPAWTRGGKQGETGLEAAEAAGGASPDSPPERGAGSAGPEQQQPPLEPDAERDAGPEQAQTSYRDLWSLRASLELHAAASDHSSSGNDRDSVRSGDSSGSGSGGAAPAFPPPSPPAPRPKDGEARRLLQMDSGYASIEGRGAGDDTEPPAAPARPRSPRAWPRRPRRDYSIDEKTDALFHEFLRHDPHFDDTPAAARHRARAHPHARKQWQRGRQHSDPGARAAPALAGTPAPPAGAARPARAPLRRGDSVDGPPDGRTLGGAGDDPAIPVIEEEPGGGGCPGSGLCVLPSGSVLDKLAAGLDERLFPPRLAEPVVATPALVAAAPTSPDHSPA
ncbi:voltage-dependent calcium channel beta subunit-associated regulatory protein isoform X2 [Homo sapiens]|nr:voltage-dependent calcium channel beta subunit-associated regulatory protein isoform X2 [Homo sapiens]|eukprot:XP_016882045.1 voltage-dependent calcium channel beta subunit-associated regulatory protein isoform X2 [Homo sapiens]